ncbi:MAG TPA: VWA domain-containing protein [Vicinamibacterales bacterium]|nr:VWA domain-containing protein [Vicinamibacterales bacterium]
MPGPLARAALVACALGAAVGAAAQDTPIFRGTADTVRVFVTVTDRDGRLVTDLTQDEFEIRDEGTPQPIAIFDNRPRPIRLIIMLDVSGSMQGNLPLLRASAQQLAGRLLPDDLARLGTFGHDVTIGETFTRDPEELLAALPDEIAHNAPTPLWRALNEAMDAFDTEDDVRRVILVLSDGKDSGPIDFRHKASSQAEVIDRARREDVMVYAVGMRSRGPRRPTPGLGPGGLQVMLTADLPDPGLARVAQETGGGYTEIRYGQDLVEAFARVADELHSQYLIGFEPPKRDGKKHDIEVKVRRKGVEPRARKSYIAPSS